MSLRLVLDLNQFEPSKKLLKVYRNFNIKRPIPNLFCWRRACCVLLFKKQEPTKLLPKSVVAVPVNCMSQLARDSPRFATAISYHLE